MKKKALLIACIFLAFIILAGTKPVHAQEPIFAVSPATITVDAPGQEFTVNFTVVGSPEVDFWSFNLTWNPAVLSITNPNTDIVEGDFLKKGGASTIFVFKDPDYTMGSIEEINCGILTTGATVTGDGLLCKINFTAVAIGESPINIDFAYLLIGIAEVYYPEIQDGSVTVIPEFPPTILIAIFLTATMAITLLMKTIKSRKRQEYIATLQN